MKVLFVDHPEADYLAATVYSGLCQELGDENVVDYPYKKSYHGEMHNYPGCYDDGGIGHTQPFDWFRSRPGNERTHTEVCEELSKFDLVVLASPRKRNAAALDDIIATVGRSALPPLVLVDGEDYADLRFDLLDHFRPSIYFKRELLENKTSYNDVRILPFPFASPIGSQPEKEKDIDVLFVGGGTWPSRAEACEALRIELGDRFVGGTNVRFDHKGYIDVLSRSKIAISVRGYGWDTLRFWEIPSCVNTLLVTDRSPQIKPYPFEDGVHALYFSSSKELVDNVRAALTDEIWRARIARAGNELLATHHTAQARARQLLEESFR